MSDHDLFLKYDGDNEEYKAKRLKVTFYDRDTPRTKYDDNERYWREFVEKWWHHDGLHFESLSLDDDQQARLDTINDENIDPRWLSQLSAYVETGYVSEETNCPYLSDIVDDTEVVENRFKVERDRKKADLERYRYQVETSGTELDDGTPILTSREAQAQLTSAYMTLYMEFTDTVDWKSPDGWVQVDRTTLEPIAQTSGRYVQRCFSAERQVAVDDLDAMTDDIDALREFDIKQAFDDALAALMDDS